jgi:putative sigma-54 modulation protein
MTQKSDKFPPAYNIAIVGKNVKITPPIQKYIFEKLNKVERLTDHILDVYVTLEVQKLSHRVHILMKFFHFQIVVKADTEDMYASIDQAVGKLVALIRKYKTKLQDHHKKELSTVEMNVKIFERGADVIEEINDEIEEANLQEDQEKYKLHEVKKVETMPLKMLTQDEAIMKMELSGQHFLIYKGQEDQKIKVIYRREDDNFGVVAIDG